MVVILILRNQLEALKVSKVYKVSKDLKAILVSADRRVSKVFKVCRVLGVRLDHKVRLVLKDLKDRKVILDSKDLKARLDREVKRGPLLPMKILHLNNLSY
jgi:hypothetical protein